MKKRIKWVLAGLLATFLALQFFNPSRVNPPVKADFIKAAHPPESVANCLRAACYDCHSDETIWPLYSRIAPVSWLVAADVREGRDRLNLSEWPAEPARQARQLDRINEVVDYREMPLKKYTLLHPDARINEAQRQAILEWTEAAAEQLRNSTNN